MTETELKNYLLQACGFLNINIKQIAESEFTLTIPDILTEDFNNAKEFTVTFKKESADTNKSYITTESFLIQKIAKLVADKGYGVTTGEIDVENDVNINEIEALFSDCKVNKFAAEKIPYDYYLVCIKITMRLNKIEEFLHCYKYNIKTKECIEIPVPDEDYIQKITTKAFEEYSRDDALAAYDDILPYIKQTVNIHFEEMQAEYEKMYTEEINRINEYYDILLSENSLPDATQKESVYESLNSERENLINEQKKKFQISDNSITVEPISICIIRENTETPTVVISNEFGRTQLQISTAKDIKCFYTDSQDFPFTVTSDNRICTSKDTFICSECGKKYYINKKHACNICNKEICEYCAAISNISGKIICKEHARICKNCRTLAAQDETFTCQQCNNSFCYACNHAQHCEVCNLLICDSCKNISAESGRSFCNEHSAQCPVCGSLIGTNELHTCSSCGVSYCSSCNPNNICKLCSGVTPADKNNPDIAKLITEYGLNASSYEFNKIGNFAVIIGKKLFIKAFLVIIDLENHKIINRIDYNLFGKKHK